MIISGTENVTDVLFGQETVSDVYFGDDLKYTAFKETPTVLTFSGKANDTNLIHFYKNDTALCEVVVEDVFTGASVVYTTETRGSQSIEIDLSFSDCTNGYTISIYGGEFVFSSYCCEDINQRAMLTGVTFGDSYGTSIGSYSFFGCDALTSVNIPVGVTEIANWAFYGCSALNDVIIPDTVTTIMECAFWGSKIDNLVIPDSVIKIGAEAFELCSSRFITIGSGVTTLGDSAFSGCYYVENLIYNGQVVADFNNATSPFDSLGKNSATGTCDVIIGSAVTTIPEYMFSKALMTRISIGVNVTTIGYCAFMDCVRVQELILNGTVTSSFTSNSYSFRKLGASSAIGTCKIIIGDNVTTIPQYMFYSDTSYPNKITSIQIGNGLRNIGNSAFRYCTGLTELNIPDTVTSIDAYAFQGCTGLIDISLGSGITAVGNYSFYNCTGVQTLTYNASVATSFTSSSSVFTSLGTASVTGACVVTVGGSIESIPAYLFYCTSSVPNGITKLVVGNNIATIGDYAFHYNTKLTDVSLGTVSVIGSDAFAYCKGLISINIPASVSAIGNLGFLNNTSLTDVYISDLTSWCNIDFADGGANPLSNDCNLRLNGVLVTNLQIPTGITNIKQHAFRGAISLTSVLLHDNITALGEYSFYNCTGLTAITIPNSVTLIPLGAFAGCSRLTSVSLGNAVKEIAPLAFYGTNLNAPTAEMYNVATLGYGCFGFLNPWTITTQNKSLAEKLVATRYDVFTNTIYCEVYSVGLAGLATTQSGGTDGVSGTINTVTATIDGTAYTVSGSWTFGQQYKFSTITYVVMSRLSAPAVSVAKTSTLSNWASDVHYCNTTIGAYSTNVTTATAGSVVEVYCNCAVEGTCLVKGTMISLANGTYKPVEDITYSDLLKVYNFETGTYDYQYPSLLAHSTTKWITKIILEDDSFIKISGVHDIYDPVLHKFVAWGNGNVKLDDAHKYHMYKDVNNELKILQVKEVEWINEETDVYCCMTGGTLTAFANDLLIGSVLLNFAGISDEDKFYDGFQLDKEEAVSYDYFNEHIYDKSSKYIILGLNLQYLQFYYDPEKTNYDDLLYPFTHFLTEPDKLNDKIVCRIGVIDNGKLTENNYYEDSEIVLPKITEPGKSKWYVVGEYKYLNPGDKFNVNFSTIIRAV